MPWAKFWKKNIALVIIFFCEMWGLKFANLISLGQITRDMSILLRAIGEVILLRKFPMRIKASYLLYLLRWYMQKVLFYTLFSLSVLGDGFENVFVLLFA